MPETETSSQILTSLDEAALLLLRRHGLLRSLISAEVKEALVNPEPLEPDALKIAVRSYCNRNKLITADQLQTHLRRQNWSQADLHWHASLPERIRRTSLQRYRAKAELHYLTRKEQFDQVTYSQLSVPNQFLAQELFLRLNEKETTFAELAAQLRKGGAEKGQGRFGPVPISSVPPVLATPLRSSTPGTLLEPLQWQSSWLLVRLEKFQPTQFDAAMEQRMCSELLQLDVDRIVDEQLAKLQPTMPISSEQTASSAPAAQP